MFAREANDDQLDEAIEILSIERRIRGARKPAGTKKAGKKPAAPASPNPDQQLTE
jgi:hypothetical protein